MITIIQLKTGVEPLLKTLSILNIGHTMVSIDQELHYVTFYLYTIWTRLRAERPGFISRQGQ